MADVFERYWQLGRAMPRLGLVMTADAVARMHDYSLGATRPSGHPNALHDGTGRRTGSVPNGALRRRAEFRKRARLPDRLPPTSQFFPAAGQAFLRDGWGEDATYVTFDATTWGGAHCHLCRNAVQLHAYGRSLIVDPGSLTYEVSDPMMAYGKSTRAHSTLNLNGWNQSEADPVTRFVHVRGYDLVASRYEGGYWPNKYHWGFYGGHGRGIFATHHRTLLWIRGRCVVVLDHLTHMHKNEPPDLEINWQLSEGPVELDRDGAWAATRHEDANVLMLFPLRTEGMTLSVHEGGRRPLRGWLPGEGKYVPAPMLSVRSKKHALWQTDLATVLVPFRGPEQPEVRAEGERTDGGRVPCLTLRWGDGTTDEVFWTGALFTAVDRAGEAATDASLVHLLRGADGEVVRGLAVDGTFVKPYAPRVRPRPTAFVFP
jgi:hypothetical protein